MDEKIKIPGLRDQVLHFAGPAKVLNAEAIDAMEAGPEMDALVAERVMGLEIEYDIRARPRRRAYVPKEGPVAYVLTTVPAYSRDIAAAWQVVEKLWHPQLSHNNGLWWFRHTEVFKGIFESAGETAPLAICRAALKATL